MKDTVDAPAGRITAVAGTGVGGYSRGTDVSISFDSHFANLHDAVFQWLTQPGVDDLVKRRQQAIADDSEG